MDDTLFLTLFIYGLGVVVALAAAVLIKLIVGVLAWTDRTTPAAPPARAPAAAGMPAVLAAGAIPPHHLVAIAAAAHAMLGAHRIVHIGRVANGPGWSAEGRISHHGSHHPSGHH